MAKVTTIPARDPDNEGTCYEGTRIELRDMSVTIRAASAKVVYELTWQAQQWATECFEEAGRLRALSTAASDVACEAIHKNWFDASGGEELHDMLSNLIDMWEARADELQAKGEAYDDTWTYLATLLDEQEDSEAATGPVRQAGKVGWGLHRPGHVDTDPYFG